MHHVRAPCTSSRAAVMAAASGWLLRLQLLWALSSIGSMTTADDGPDLPLVPQLNKSDSFGIFWSCGSSIKFATCSTAGNVTCTPEKTVLTTEAIITAADVYYDAHDLYYIANGSEVHRLRLATGEQQTLHRAAREVELSDIAVDWLNQELYLVQDRQILRCDLNISSCTAALPGRVVNATEISVDPNNGYIFWMTHEGGAFRDILPSDGVSKTNGSQPVTLLAAQSSCPGKGFATVSQQGVVYLYFYSTRRCSGIHPEVASVVFNRTGPVGPVISKYTSTEQGGIEPLGNASFDDSRGSLVCTSKTTCMWMEPAGRLRVADLGRNASLTVAPDCSADGCIAEAGRCVVLAGWHRDLQVVPLPHERPKNVEVIFRTTSAIVTWEPPPSSIIAILQKWRPLLYEPSWRNWMYKVLIRAASSRASALSNTSIPAPEVQVCHVPPRGVNKCLFGGLSRHWMYSVSVIAYSAAGESPASVVYGSPPSDDSLLLMVTTAGLAYSLLRFRDGTQYSAVTGAASPSSDAGSLVSGIHDATAADHGKMYLVLANFTLVTHEIASGIPSPWDAGGGSTSSSVTSLPRLDTCALVGQAEAVAWDWVSGSLYVATKSSILRSAAGCSGRGELLIEEGATALALEPLSARIMLWITADGRALKYCKLGPSCQANVTTIYSMPCQQSLLGRCAYYSIRSLAVDVEEGSVYWSVLAQSNPPTVKTYATSLAQPNVWQELSTPQMPSVPSIAVYGGKLLRIVNRTKMEVRDIRGNASGYYLLSSPASGLWFLRNYSMWLLPGFSSIGEMNAATRPAHVSNDTARVTVEGTWSNFTIRWPHLNTSTAVDVLYNVTVSGAEISPNSYFVNSPSVHLPPDSIPPYTRLSVTVTAFTPWVTGEPFTVDVYSPAKAPPAPEGLQSYVENATIHIYWDQQYLSGAPVINTTVFVATPPENGSLPLNYAIAGFAGSIRRHFSFSCQTSAEEYFVKALSCNTAGCSSFSSPLRISTRVGEFTPLPQVMILQPSGLIVNGDFSLTMDAVVDTSLDGAAVYIAAIVGETCLTLVWIDSNGCLYQKLSEARGIRIQVTCGLTLPLRISVESSRRRLYILQNGSSVVQVDLVTMAKTTVFQTAERKIVAIASYEHQRKLYVLTDEHDVVELSFDAPHQQTHPRSLTKKRAAETGCNCTYATGTTSAHPKSYTLVITNDGAIAAYYLDTDGTVWKTDESACHCWPMVLASSFGVPGFIPDEISSGGRRLYLYSKLSNCVVSVDLLGRNPFLLESMMIRNIWPYSTNIRGAFAQAPVPSRMQLTVLNANEVRVSWQCLLASCYATAALDPYLMVWQVPEDGTRPVASVSFSLHLPSSPFLVNRLLPATKYSMQVWVCSRDNRSCSFSSVSDIQMLHAPEIPVVTSASNVSLTFRWTAPVDDSIISHHIRLESTTGTETGVGTVVATAASSEYSMSIHDLQPATDYLARMVVVYKQSNPREYLWPVEGVLVTTNCSPPTSVTISKVDCGDLFNSSCILILGFADSRLISKCHISFNLTINCRKSEEDGGRAALFLNSLVPEFVVPASNLPPPERRKYCSAFACAVSADGVGPLSSPVQLPTYEDSSTAGRQEAAEVHLAGILAGAGVVVAITLLGVGLCLQHRRHRQKQSLAKNRARREDRRSPEAGGLQSEDSMQLVVLRHDPGFDLVTNAAYQTESILRHEPAAPNGAGSSGGGSKLPGIDRQAIQLLRPLGAGAFGEVHAGIAEIAANGRGSEKISAPIAVKTLRSDATMLEKSEFLKEATLMSQFHHKNVVRLIGVCSDADPLYIVIELMDEGDLLNFVRQKRPTRDMAGQLSLHMLLHMSLDIARGCEYLESLHFVHRDLAARNCLVSTSGHTDSCPLVKIGDFGLARDVYRNDYYRKEGEALLPVRWMSPESLVDGVFTNQSDVWSFGVLMWEVFSLGMQPYAAKSNGEVLYLVRNAGTLDRPRRCPLSMFQLISQCWSYVPQERPSFKAVRSFVQQILSDADQDSSLVAAYDRCNGRLTSNQEFFSTSSEADDVPMSARMVRQLSDVFDAEVKDPAAGGPVEYRSQNSFKGRLSKMFRRSANSSLLNRIHSQTDPESRKSNVYVRSDSVLSSDAVASQLLSNSREGVASDEFSGRDDGVHPKSFGDFILDSIAADQTLHGPHAAMASHETLAEAVSYSLVTPAAKPSGQRAPTTTAQARPQSGARVGFSVDAPREPKGNTRIDAFDGRLGKTDLPAACAAASPAAVDYSLVVALPSRPKVGSSESVRGNSQSVAVASRHGNVELPGACAAAAPDLDPLAVELPSHTKLVGKDSFQADCEPCSVTCIKPPVATKKSLPNSYAFDAHGKDGAAIAATVVNRSASRRRDDLGLKPIDYSGCEPVSK